jgi:predicted permease
VLQILWQVIAPIFLMMGVGYGVQRTLGFDIRSLTRLNFWIFVPSFLFVKIVSSSLSFRELVSVALHFTIFFLLMFALAWGAATLIGAGERMRRAMTASVLFYNSGNYGVPVAQLAFPGSLIAESVQAITMTMQNFTNFTIGLSLHAGGQEGMGRRDTILAMFKLPMIYTFIAAAVWRTFSLPVPGPVWQALETLAQGLVPIALVTLGAQMATLKSHRFTREMSVTLLLRLILGPVLAFFIVKLLHIEGLLAQAIVVSTSFPTAINSALLAIEYNNEPDYAAATVFYSTLISSATVSLVIYAVTHMKI